MRSLSFVLLSACLSPALAIFDRFNPIQFILRRKLRCWIRYRRFNFDIGDFTRYDRYFRDYSVLQEAHAGSFYGPEDIEKYVGFGYNTTSPFLAQGPDYKATGHQIVGFNNGQCEIIYTYVADYKTNSDNTLEETRYRETSMVKIFLDFDERYITRVNVYYPKQYLHFFFDDILGSSNTQDYICNVLNNQCISSLGVTIDCKNQLADLPTTEDERNIGNAHVDGNSQGCRALYGSFAAANPDQDNCAHVALQPTPDSDDLFKCQTSSDTQVFELFTESDLDFFGAFQRLNAIDSDVGYLVLN